MKKFLLIAVFTIFSLSCGYKVKTYPHYTFYLKSFEFKDPFLLQFKKDIEWFIKDKLFETGFLKTKNESSDFIVSIVVEHYKTFTVQSGSDNRQTAKEMVFKVKCLIKFKNKPYKFKDTIKLYPKFPVKSEYFVDERKELAIDLAEQIALRVNAWITKIIS